ncbi:hypothetical protein MUB24_07350 [Lederbergia sp. NSJ-179]|uniref:hypothetical protein n=1 Tax=Lederbergia sp. NSJ-179 TaxID=2931402 RepID=UPI001FD4910F|nr:hypothetical protein [Lederbergia sp. NSJ-179]MCJ7840725.1 hypothetical protein [Lederbergia sp. NSJ-179]
MDQYTPFLGVRRAYPMAVAGTIVHYCHDHEQGSFQMEWEENAKMGESTIIYFPNIQEVEEATISLSPLGSSYKIHKIEDSSAGYLEIPTARNGVWNIVLPAGKRN